LASITITVLAGVSMSKVTNIIFVAGFVLCSVVISYIGSSVLTVRHLTFGITTLVLSVLLLLSKDTDFSIIKNPVFIAFAVYWFWVTYSICFAVNSGEAVFQSCKVVRDIAFLFCAVNILRRLNISKTVIVTTIFLGSYSLFEFFTKPVNLRSGLMDNKNLCAASFVLLMILCAYHYKDWKIPSLIAIGISLFIIVTLRARSSWLAVIVCGLLMTKKYFAPCLFAFTILSLVALKLNSPVLNTNSLDQRFNLWKTSLLMTKDYPSGVGAGNWKLIFPKYIQYASNDIKKMMYTIKTDGKNWIWGRPHNAFVLNLTEVGIFGLLSYIALFALTLYYSSGWIKTGIVAYIVLSCFTFPGERAYLSLLLMIFFAYALKDCKPVPFKFKKVYALGVIVLLVFGVIDFGIKNQMSNKMVEIVRARNRDWDRVIKATDKISPLANLDSPGQALAYYRGVAYAAKKDPDNALKSFKQARKANPYHLHVLMNLSALSVVMGEVREAECILTELKNMYPDYIDIDKNIQTAEKYRVRNFLLGKTNGG